MLDGDLAALPASFQPAKDTMTTRVDQVPQVPRLLGTVRMSPTWFLTLVGAAQSPGVPPVNIASAGATSC